MSRPFTHLHVASGYSLRYGASNPRQLVQAAAAQGMSSLALTDRDGLYGAVKFTEACEAAGLAPVLGVDLAVEPTGMTAGLPTWAAPAAPVACRTPVRGGASVDPRHPRVTVLALGENPAAGLEAGQGWGRLCRLVTATQLRGERGAPVSTVDLVGEHTYAAGPGSPAALVVMLGPASEFGRAVLAKRPDVALAVLRRWQAVVPADGLVVEIVNHRGPYGTPGSRGHAARMLTVAREAGVPAVLTNAVRYVERDGAMTVDVLDAARRLVALDGRHLDRTTAEGYLAGPEEMRDRAIEVADAAGRPEAARELLEATEAVAARCRLVPGKDLGFTHVHLPEPQVIGLRSGQDANAELRRQCEARVLGAYPNVTAKELRAVRARLRAELKTIAAMGIPTYFLTIARVCQLIREMDVRVAARGSGAGSLVNYLLRISGVDPMRHNLLMERFATPLRHQLPDVDLDVESDRRTDVYERILQEFGGDRVTCVSMMDTYRVRHAVRDVGAALGLPPREIDTIAKSFPHIRARDARNAIAELPELQASGLGEARLDLLFDLVERLDGLPRHVALHPCGVIISDATLLNRTPVEASWLGFPMSQFDKDDVEIMGLLKLDVLGIRMQSAMSYAIKEITRVDGPTTQDAGGHEEGAPYLTPENVINLDKVPLDDETTFRLIRTTRTLGCFQIESPGQRELVGKFGPETFLDLIIDISLFRPGPVKSDMIRPFLRNRKGLAKPDYLHPKLVPALEDTSGVVVFHEQVLQILNVTTGITLAQADEVRRQLGSPEGQLEFEPEFREKAEKNGFDAGSVEKIWEVLKAFASFGFCKAHAAAFALPTYQSAWLKAHHPAAFLAGVLTHDPGMYPKRLILDDARNLGISVLPLDVNHSDATYRVEKLDPATAAGEWGVAGWGEPATRPADPDLPDGRAYGIRLALAEVKGANAGEVERMVANRPYQSLADFWHRARVSRPVVERLVRAGAFDSLYGLTEALPVPARGNITRRDLLLQVGDLERWTRANEKTAPGRKGRRPAAPATEPLPGFDDRDSSGVRRATARQSKAALPVLAAEDQSVQLSLDLGDSPDRIILSGLPEMTGAERVRAELDVLGLDASRHVLDFYAPMLNALQTTRARDILTRANGAELLVAGVKVATQTPPIRTGRRVVFLTLDDSTGPLDATFFEDVQGPYAATIFHSWLLVVRGVLRKTGARGISIRATGAWELPLLWDAWTRTGLDGVQAIVNADPDQQHQPGRARPAIAGLPAAAYHGGVVLPADPGSAAPGRAMGTNRDDGALPGGTDQDAEAPTGLPTGDYSRPSPRPAAARAGTPADLEEGRSNRAGGMGGGRRPRRVLVNEATGYKQSPYADLQPPGDNTQDTRRMLANEEATADEKRRHREAPRKLWHSSPGSSGH